MFGVIARPGQKRVVEEFFELFKTPWEFYRPGTAYDVVIATTDEVPEVQCRLLLVYSASGNSLDARLGIAAGERRQETLVGTGDAAFPVYRGLLTFANAAASCCLWAGSAAAGVRIDSDEPTLIRLGYDLFAEVEALLSTGQPVAFAAIPTLDRHIAMLRNWVVGAGIPLLEIPPAPAGYRFGVCLTHDIDFVGIRRHRFDHSMWGFVYRATVGALARTLQGKLTFARLFKAWAAAASLPFVLAGWVRDFWEPFAWYLRVEAGLAATYYLIPFKRRAGHKVPRSNAAHRATAYDVSDLNDWTPVLLKNGCELGVHGIDSWHSAESGREELKRLTDLTGKATSGIRMHWLLNDANTPSVLEAAGYEYDSTCGYNETVGYLAGTGQVFRPLPAQTLLELPMHIQDGALFYPQRLDLSEAEAAKRCDAIVANAQDNGGAVTLLWHDRSHGPERFWGDFYIQLVEKLKAIDCWFATAGQMVGWFRKRRQVRFEQVASPATSRIRVRYEGPEIEPPLKVRVYMPAGENHGEIPGEFVDISWNGNAADAPELPVGPSLAAALPRN